MTYQPSDKILNKYADVLVNFALNNCTGVKKGQTVLLQVPECAKPMLAPLRNAVLKAGANPLIQYIPDGISKEFFDLANKDQLTYSPDNFLAGRLKDIDCSIYMIAEHDLKELDGVDPKKLMLRQSSFKKYSKLRQKKELDGKFAWLLALYGTPAMAKEAKMSLEDYWKQIIKACYLNKADPVAEWKKATKEIYRVKNKLTKLDIKSLHLTAKDTDIKIGLGKNRKWLGGSGRNIPSFEVFISPDWRETEGKIRFTEPLYIHGNIVKDIYLEFENGLITKATAKSGQKFLKEMIDVKDANKVGEFSLTDSRLSKITKFMANTLYDENVGGKEGNTHLAVGMAFKESYSGDPTTLKSKDFKELGFNDSMIHTDIVSTSKRKVVAELNNGKKKLIYENGKFVI